MSTGSLYADDTIRVDDDGVTIRGYFFPLGRPKRIAFDEIVGVDVHPAGFMARWRLWGSNNFRNWMPLDMGRPRKEHLVSFNLGKRITPTVTPADPERVAALVREHI